MFITLQSLALNVILDPLLIFGIGGLPRLGVQGAAVASLVSQVYGLVVYGFQFYGKRYGLRLSRPFHPDPRILKRCLEIGVPSGVTYFLIAVNMLIIYRIVGGYGTAALASVGIGCRIIQSLYLPVVALTSAMGAVAGQNVGTGNPGRVEETFRTGWRISMPVMLAGTGLCWLLPETLLGFFTDDPEVLNYGRVYLTVISLGNVLVGSIMAVSSIFQGLGKTYPSLAAAVVDNALFAALGFTLPRLTGWGIRSIWWIRVFTTFVEVLLLSAWLRRELGRVRLGRPNAAIE